MNEIDDESMEPSRPSANTGLLLGPLTVQSSDPAIHEIVGAYLLAAEDKRKLGAGIAVDFGPASGEVDQVLSALFRVRPAPGETLSAASVDLLHGEQLAVSVHVLAAGLLLVPRRGFQIGTVQLPDGRDAMVIGPGTAA